MIQYLNDQMQVKNRTQRLYVTIISLTVVRLNRHDYKETGNDGVMCRSHYKSNFGGDFSVGYHRAYPTNVPNAYIIYGIQCIHAI